MVNMLRGLLTPHLAGVLAKMFTLSLIIQCHILPTVAGAFEHIFGAWSSVDAGSTVGEE